MDAFLDSFDDDNHASLRQSTSNWSMDETSLAPSSPPRNIRGTSDISALDVFLDTEDQIGTQSTPSNTPTNTQLTGKQSGAAMYEDFDDTDEIAMLQELTLNNKALHGGHRVSGVSPMMAKDECLADFTMGKYTPHINGGAANSSNSSWERPSNYGSLPIGDDDDDDDDDLFSLANGGEHGLGFTRKIRSQMKAEQRRILTDHLSMLIDDSQLAPMFSMEGYTDRCKEVVLAAAQLIRQVGIENVAAIQLSPYSHVDDMGRLQSYVLIVKKSAPIAPILATMPNYGAGRSVFTDIRHVHNASRYGEIVFEEAQQAIRCLMHVNDEGESTIVDYSNPQSEHAREKAHAYLAAIRQSSNMANNIIADSFMRESNSSVVADIVSSEMSEQEKLKQSRFLSLGGYDTSIGIYSYNRRPAIICDNYSQMTVDLIRAKVEDGTFRNVAEFLDSPIRNMAIEHGRIARSAVIARVAQAIDDETRDDFSTTPVTFLMAAQRKVQGKWTLKPTTVPLEYDHVYNHIRSVTERSDEWQMFLSRYEEARKAIGGEVYEAHRRLLESPASDYAIVFNHMNDPSYCNLMGQGASEKQGFTMDMGNSNGMTVVRYNQKARIRSGFLGVPVSSMRPPNRNELAEKLCSRTKAIAEESVGYAAELHNLDILPLEVSAFHTEDHFRCTFTCKEVCRKMKQIHETLRKQFIATLSFDDIDQPELFRNIYRWSSSVDPSMLSLRQRLQVADPYEDIIIDTRHKEQLKEVFALLLEHIGHMSNKEDAELGLLGLFQPGSDRVNPNGYVLKLNREFAYRLLDGF